MSGVVFEYPAALVLGPACAAAVLGWLGVAQRRRGVSPGRIAALAAVRGLVLLTLAIMAARPVRQDRAEPPGQRRSVVLLVDRSESMALEDNGAAREQQAVRFARDQLLPALKAEGLKTRAFLFAEDAREASGTEVAGSVPDGRETNLAGAIFRSTQGLPVPPLAVIALTDGAATETRDNHRAVTALLDQAVPFVGIGFGSEVAVRTVAVRHALAPPAAPVNQEFTVSAQLETTGEGEAPGFDIVLLRDGQFRQKRAVHPGRGSHSWLEGFQVTEDKEGAHTYTVRLMPPADAGVRCVNAVSDVSVRISEGQILRILFAQGALTWNYKFINLAVRGDPTAKLTGLSRTSKQSVYYQNVENASELAGGFPTRMEDLAAFRVVVLSNLKPADLTPAQQDLLARFCGEFGGGVLLIGGAETFDASWQNSRLEQLLPVRFAGSSGLTGQGRPFRLKLTEEARRSPFFQVGPGGTAAGDAVWNTLPTFLGYGRVDSAKPGARVWIEHSDEAGPHGPRILLASQQFGSGLSAVFCVQNLWRWRLARNSDPHTFDRFWQQFFRFLSEGSRENMTIRFPDQELRPRSDVRFLVERRPDPKAADAGRRRYIARVEDPAKKTVTEQTVELAPAGSVEATFRADAPGTYSVAVLDMNRGPLASRTVEVTERRVEFEHATRDMENLRQWAGLTNGVAVKAEDCQNIEALIRAIKERGEAAVRSPARSRPAGINVWTLYALLTCLAVEFALRKIWNLA